MKKQQIWVLLKCVGLSVAILLTINLATFLLGLVLNGSNVIWEFYLKQGVFSLNGRTMGLKFFEPAAIGLMLVMFIAVLAHGSKRSQSNSRSK